MNVTLESKSTYNLFDTPLIHQSAFWSLIKQKQGYEALAFDIKIKLKDLYTSIPSSGYVVDDLHLIVQPINRDYSIGYIPYGPLISPDEELRGDFIEELSEQLISKLPSHCVALRYDLPWESPFEEDISVNSQQVRLNYGTANHNIRKAVSDSLPSTTLFIDLTRSEEEILSSMKQKTRYNIGLAKLEGDEAAMLNFLRMEKWIADRPDHPGEAARQWLNELYRENRLVKGTFEVCGKKVDLSKITCPVLNIYAEQDHIVPVSCSKALGKLVDPKLYEEIGFPGGHVGVFVSRKAQGVVAGGLIHWIVRPARSAPKTKKKMAKK